MRLTVLFCIVAAITAVVIFAIIPTGNKTEKNVADVPAATPEKTPAPETAEKVVENTPAKEDNKTAPTLFETVKPQRSGSSDPDAEQLLRTALAAGDFKAFFQLADKLITATPADSEARAQLGDILTDGRRKAWQSGKWKHCAAEYRVVSGDYPLRIAQRNQTTLEMLLLGNGLKKDSRINISQRLFLIPGPWKIIVSQKAQLLTLLQKESIFAVFKVAVNDKKPLPSGNFTIRKRVKSPVFIDRHGRHFPSGSEANMLGDAMIYLRRQNARGGRFGIHGVSEKNRSINSHCIQMRNDDVLMLYHLLPTATPVEVTD